LNEEALLPEFLAHAALLLDRYAGDIEWVLVDSGSSDRSAELVRDWCRGRSGACLVERDLQNTRGPSIGRALNHSLRSVRVQGDWVQVVPADCALSQESVRDILQGLSAVTRIEWFCCPKRYEPETWSLHLYSWIQNTLRLRALGRAVWTNGMAVRRESLAISPFPELGFMEDSLWCDALIEHQGRPRVLGQIRVSARRYYPDRTLRRIGINFLVISLYRAARMLPLMPIEQVLPRLRRLYLSLR